MEMEMNIEIEGVVHEVVDVDLSKILPTITTKEGIVFQVVRNKYAATPKKTNLIEYYVWEYYTGEADNDPEGMIEKIGESRVAKWGLELEDEEGISSFNEYIEDIAKQLELRPSREVTRIEKGVYNLLEFAPDTAYEVSR